MARKKDNSPRQIALDALVACEKQGAWSDGILRRLMSGAKLDRRDAALASRLCYGVQQNLLLLNFWIGEFSTVPVKKLEVPAAAALRLAMYQIVLMDRIPDSAAVNTAVDLTRANCRNPHTASLVNGILRGFVRRKESLPMPEDGERISILYSHPQWLVELFRKELGDEEKLEMLLRTDNSQPATCIQVNTIQTTADDLLAELLENGVEAERHPWLSDCLLVTKTGNLESLESFRRGAFLVQDAAARLAVMALDPQPGEKLLDVCGAPGGKSFSSAIAMGGRGELTTCDIHPHKVKLIGEGAQRLGLSCITPMLQNGREFRPEWENAFDRVITDVPCSGLGIIRKKPDIRYKDEKQLEGLPSVQGAILNNACRYVKPGGVLLYATCTVLSRENGEIVDEFLRTHPEFHPEDVTLPGPVGRTENGRMTLWPHLHDTDGFFFAKLRKE